MQCQNSCNFSLHSHLTTFQSTTVKCPHKGNIRHLYQLLNKEHVKKKKASSCSAEFILLPLCHTDPQSASPVAKIRGNRESAGVSHSPYHYIRLSFIDCVCLSHAAGEPTCHSVMSLRAPLESALSKSGRVQRRPVRHAKTHKGML